MLLVLWKDLKGYVRINISGFSKERLLNLLAANNIYAWDIVYNGRFITLCVTVAGLKKMRPALKKTGCHFKIVSKIGLPFYIFRHRKRGAFAAGFILFLVLIFIMSQFIWLIDIDGNTGLSDADILAYLKTKGIYTGVLKNKINVDSLKTDIRHNFPQISWISIVKRGTRLLVELNENVESGFTANNARPNDIICKYDCIITQITAQNGTPCVKVGDTVKTGDVLIRSAFDIKDDSGQNVAVPPANSVGIVRGKRYVSIAAQVPYNCELKTYTGKIKKIYSISIFGIDFNYRFFKTLPKFKYYDTFNKNIQLGLGVDHPLPAVLKKTVYKEYTIQKVFLTRSRAENAVQKLLNKKILSALPYSASVLDKKINFTYDPDKITAKAELLVEDDIGGNPINGTNEISDR